LHVLLPHSQHNQVDNGLKKYSHYINSLKQDGTGVARNFAWEEPKLENFSDVILVTFYGDVTEMTL